jgi:hypothetical protein
MAPDERTVDLTEKEPGAGLQPVRPPGAEGVPRQRETIRGIIALVLIAMLGVVIMIAVVASVFLHRVDDAKGILEVVLPPVVALTGTAMGFYFGGQDSNQS